MGRIMLRNDKNSLSRLGLVLFSAWLFTGCNGPATDADELSHTVQAVDICNETVPANRNVDGIPAYAQCTTTTNSAIYSNNGVDTSTTSGGTDWVRTQYSGGYQCTELAHRYWYFHWNVTWIPNGNAGTWCDTVPPASSGVVQATTPVHGDLIVFAPGVCGADATTGHVAVVDVVVNATTVTIVEENSAGRRNSQQSCAKCFLHVVANTGSGGSGGATSTGGSNAGGLTGAGGSSVASTGGRMNTGGARATGGLSATGASMAIGGNSTTTGGATNNSAGSSSGGSPNTGGNAATGGRVAATGGASSTGGGAAVGTGGAIAATGGNAATGGTPGIGGDTSANSLSNGGGPTGTGGNSTSVDTGTGTPADSSDAGSCSCRVAGQPTRLAGFYGFGLLGLLLLRKRRQTR